MLRLGGVLVFIAVLVWLYAFYDALTAPAERVRNLPKAVWLLIVLLLPEIGAIAWFVWGRPRTEVRARVRQSPFGRQAHGGARRHRPLAPDDDAEFLRRLDDDRRRDRGDDNPPGAGS
jgi:Phospholipase_D-nuclease N-terminal